MTKPKPKTYVKIKDINGRNLLKTNNALILNIPTSALNNYVGSNIPIMIGKGMSEYAKLNNLPIP